MYTHPLHTSPDLKELYSQYEKKAKIGADIKAAKAELKKKRSLLQMDELKCRKRVLRRLEYSTASDVIEIKGRVACEISRYWFFLNHCQCVFQGVCFMGSYNFYLILRKLQYICLPHSSTAY